MTGKQLKEKIQQKGIKFAALAKMLDLAPQQVQQYFIAQNVSTDVLERISEAMGESVSYFYNEYPILSMEEYAHIAKLEQENTYLRQLLNEKERTIQILMTKKEE